MTVQRCRARLIILLTISNIETGSSGQEHIYWWTCMEEFDLNLRQLAGVGQAINGRLGRDAHMQTSLSYDINEENDNLIYL